MGRIFGTDGVRGVANTELNCELAMNLGRAAAMVLTDNEHRAPKILIGKDTRISSNMLEGALIAGLCSVGANVVTLGYIPTPAVAFLVGKYKADAGFMISASHNSFEFNGIKIFNGDGFKLADALEERIEEIVLDEEFEYPKVEGKNIGKVTQADNAVRDYIDHIKSTVPFALTGMKVAFDCANGSASVTAKTLFSELGAEVHMLYSDYNGININDDCGSTHMQNLIDYVKSNDVECGIAFDGDADRCLAVDKNGNIVDGDVIMAICASDLKSRGKLNDNAVVGTIMSNMGFIRFCEENKIKFNQTKVGDRYVLEDMLMEGYNLGGEQSGHVIFLDFATTGDGQLTAAHLLSILKRRNARLSSLATLMEHYPQVMINVKVSAEGRLRFYTDSEIKAAILKEKEALGKRGRIVVRVSGTEPLVRVMLEGESEQEITQIAQKLADLVQVRLS
ncbi:MAG: phosphoglucosamine mutase [Clostridia bacterium]|nr:phosphoglucosamine mutase [Clostridia bacterium]